MARPSGEGGRDRPQTRRGRIERRKLAVALTTRTREWPARAGSPTGTTTGCPSATCRVIREKWLATALRAGQSPAITTPAGASIDSLRPILALNRWRSVFE
jgi:hypothetical protein